MTDGRTNSSEQVGGRAFFADYIRLLRVPRAVWPHTDLTIGLLRVTDFKGNARHWSRWGKKRLESGHRCTQYSHTHTRPADNTKYTQCVHAPII